MNLKLELLREELPSHQQEQLDAILSEIDRLDSLTESHLRTTRRRLEQQTSATDLHQVLNETLQTLQPEIKEKNLCVLKNLNAQSIATSLPANVLKAVLINLIKNAWEAMDESKERTLFIESSLDKNSENWSLTLSDTGCGFPENILKQPFQNFQTSKPQGSGLGLSTSWQMLSSYGVSLSIEPASPPYKAQLKLTGKTVYSFVNRELQDKMVN